MTTSGPSLGTPKSDHHQIDPKFCPVLPSSWAVWNIKSLRGQKVDLIEKRLIFRQVGPQRGGGLGTESLYFLKFPFHSNINNQKKYI